MKQVLFIGAGFVLVITLMAFGIHPITEPLPQCKVALYSGQGTMPLSTDGIKNSLAAHKELIIEEISEQDVRSGRLRNYRVVILPGGTGSGLREALGKEGCRSIEKFVSGGGGYIGICAGAYLPTLGWKESMQDIQLINARLHDLDNWERGVAMIECVAMTKGGSKPLPFQIHFQNGPVFVPGNDPYLPDYVSLARFKTDLHTEGAPAGQMADRDAIIASRFGMGRVILFSPHPEMTPGLDTMLAQSIRWAAGQSDAQTTALGPEFSWEGIFGIAVFQSR